MESPPPPPPSPILSHNKTIYCAVHEYTTWEPELIQIIDTREFQRLRRIKQLAAVHHVFPCAVHTRFEHSLGVGYLAHKFAKALSLRHPELNIDPFVFKLAGLCHDLGHGPLSHAYDRFLGDDKDLHHEGRSVSLLRGIVEKNLIPISASRIEKACELIYPKIRNLPEYAYQIIANDIDHIDVDKMDYILRDSLYTGLKYMVDVNRLIEYAQVINGRLCYSDRCSHTINHMFMVRHQLHAQVYQHPVVRGIEYMYFDYMRHLGKENLEYKSLDDFLLLTDAIFSDEFVLLLHATNRLTDQKRDAALSLLDRIVRRDLYHCVESKVWNAWSGPPPSDDHVILDIVRIGYSKNPMFSVHFFDDSKEPYTLKEDESSVLFAVASEDTLLRIYTR